MESVVAMERVRMCWGERPQTEAQPSTPEPADRACLLAVQGYALERSFQESECLMLPSL